MNKYIIATAVVALTSTASLAAQEFYLAQDVKTKACEVEQQKPDGVTKTMIGTASYSTRAEAKAAKKAAPECKQTEPKAK
jgi:uncharacterized protein YdeI (BOF family)